MGTRGMLFLIEISVLLPFVILLMSVLPVIDLGEFYQKFYTISSVHDAILNCFAQIFSTKKYETPTCAKFIFSLYCKKVGDKTILRSYSRREDLKEFCRTFRMYGVPTLYVNVYAVDTKMSESLYYVKDPYEFIKRNVKAEYVGTIICSNIPDIVSDGPYPKEGNFLCTYWVVSGSKGDCDSFILEFCV